MGNGSLSSFGWGSQVDVAGSDGVLVVAATNQPHVLDAALLRPGRLSQRIFIPPPNSDDRQHILKIHTRKVSPFVVFA